MGQNSEVDQSTGTACVYFWKILNHARDLSTVHWSSATTRSGQDIKQFLVQAFHRTGGVRMFMLDFWIRYLMKIVIQGIILFLVKSLIQWYKVSGLGLIIVHFIRVQSRGFGFWHLTKLFLKAFHRTPCVHDFKTQILDSLLNQN